MGDVLFWPALALIACVAAVVLSRSCGCGNCAIRLSITCLKRSCAAMVGAVARLPYPAVGSGWCRPTSPSSRRWTR
mgnify:CR=1 FL=1